MTIANLLIANRGEIAIRIARAAADLGIRTVAVFSEDDVLSLHTRKADDERPLRGRGVGAYLDIEQILMAAREAGCDAIHPGYGFLSENAGFARRCAEEGITFVGPQPDVLDLFGDKGQARALAEVCGIPLLPGTAGATSLDEAKDFLASLGENGAIMIKAIAGGGGRGMRPVRSLTEIEEAFARCQSEARAAFGHGEVYVEQLIPQARHIEVQIIGDGTAVSHVWERECTLQRRNQKLVEIAPSPGLAPGLREKLTAAAVTLAQRVRYESLGTFEFLVDATASGEDATFAFIEANPRLQVEHTVTEEVMGIDLVRAQLEIASGRSLDDLGLSQADIPTPRGFAIQVRINMETMDASGAAKPSSGTLTAFDVPSGPGIRVDTFGYAGYSPSPSFDSLLAKLITHSPSSNFAEAVAKSYRALSEFRIDGVATNLDFLQTLLRHPDVAANRVYTRFVEDHISALLAPEFAAHRRLYFERSSSPAVQGAGQVGAIAGPDNTLPVPAPMLGTVVSIDVREGDIVHQGQQVAVLEAMKMEHEVTAGTSGVVRLVAASPGSTLGEGYPVVFIEPTAIEASWTYTAEEVDLDAIRPDLAEVIERHRIGLDEGRPEAVARRRKTNQRTARENLEDLCDPGSFIEYGPLALAAQRQRRSLDELLRISPADGLVAGIGAVNGHVFDETKARCMVMVYDYTVFAGTQGMMNHKKKDRLLRVAEKWRLPIVIFTEGGGGRPGETDHMGFAGLDLLTFHEFGRLSGLMPRVGINSGRCFAGNAALLGTCDVVIATENSNIGMGGPAMIEGGGLGVYTPEEVGPMSVQVPNGVVDIAVADEAEAVRAAKQYLSYFQGPLPEWDCADQRLLRRAIPENRLRAYDIRAVIETLADTGSVLELRRGFGVGMITALIRIEGRPMGLIANNPTHLGGAIDAEAADKAARFMQLCDAFGLPILSLCDTPGFMVGPEAEKTALVRRVSRMFVTAGSLSVPIFTIVLRKGYGLGAQAMAGGSFHTPFFIVSWPTGEFGGMGLEGAVRLGYRKELAAVEDPQERQALFEKMVAAHYREGKAINMAAFLEIDGVIDPLESRRWIVRGLQSLPPLQPVEGKRRSFIDTW